MRMVLVVVLALIAIGAGGVWALGQFGDNLIASPAGEAREPIVREPELVAANDAPVAAPTPNATPSLQTQPAAAPAVPAPAAEPSPALDAATATPDAESAAKPLKPNALDTSRARSAAPAPGDFATAPPPPPPAPAGAPSQTVSPVAPPASEPVVTTQSVPAAPAASAAAAGVIANLASQFKSRKVTYNRPPAKLSLNKAIDVSLVINATADADAAKDALQGFPGTVVERDVDLSDTVAAQLTGVGFDITSQTIDRQKLSGKTINRWQWRVTPTETGTRTLLLEIFGYESGSLDAEPLDAYRDEIVVEVQQLDQVINWAKAVQPVFAMIAALAAAISAAVAFMRFRSDRKTKKSV